jgi:hypothetical protein
MPAAFEQLVHQLSLMPMLGLALGLYVLRDLERKEISHLKKFLLLSLLGLDGLIVFAVPIVFGWVWPVVMATVAILFGMSVMGVAPVKQIVAMGVFFVIIFGATVVKEAIRILMCGGGGCERVSIQKVLQKDNLLTWVNRPDFLQEGTLSSLIRIQRGLENQKKLYEKAWDPNIKSIRFVPAQLKDSLPFFLVAKILYRINYLGQLGYVYQTTGDEIPYTYGRTYYPLLLKFIPRLLWPGKPKETTGQYFGHRYGFLAEEDLLTSVNMSVIIEGYMNWGWFGIVFSAMFVGVVLRLLWELWVGENCATGNVILGMVVVFAMVGQESNLSGLFGGLLYGGVLYWIIEVFFRNCFNLKLGIESSH